MEKIGETTITRIEPQQVRTTPVEKGGPSRVRRRLRNLWRDRRS